MSGWDRIAGATNGRGSGAVAFRLVIGGLPAQAVSDARMEGSNPTRYRGLRMDGFKLSERVDPLRARVSAEGFTAVIADDQATKRWTAIFAKKPPATTYLNADLSSGTTASMTVLDSSLFASSGYVWIGTEAIAYTSKGSSTAFTTLTRGALNTIASSHYTGDGRDLRFPEVTDHPVTLLGQRAEVYAYGAGDSPTGDGTLIWRGVVAGDPSFEAGAWSILIDPITSILDQELGADLAEPVGLRGIYLPRTGAGGLGDITPLRFQIVESSTAVYGGAPGAVAEVEMIESNADTAFFETQELFVQALNAKIATAATAAGLSSTIRAVSDGDDGYHFQVRTAGASPKYITISPTTIGLVEPTFNDYLSDVTGALVSTVSTSTDYWLMPVGGGRGGTVPRGIFKPSISAASAWFTPSRLYLSGGVEVSSNVSAVLAEWPDDVGGERAYDVTAINSSTRSVDLFRDYDVAPPGEPDGGIRRYYRGAAPSIRLGREYATGSVGDLVLALTNARAAQVNLGASPDLRAADVDLSTWLTLSEGYGQPSMVRSRRFWSFGPKKLGDLLSEELKLAGYYPSITSTGTIGIKRLELAPPTRLSSRTIKVVVDGDSGFPSYERASFGKCNTVRVHTEYSFSEDKHQGTPIVFRDVASFAQSPTARVLEIRPYSEFTGGSEPYEEVVALGARIAGVFAGPYATVQVAVSLVDFAVTVGDTVLVTSPHLPDVDGSLGIVATPMIVLSRQWEPRAARGRLSLLTSTSRLGGYCPEAVVSSQSNTSGNTWEITVGTTEFPSSFASASYWFEAGDLVRVWELDDSSTTPISGTVTSASGNVVTVTFDTTWTPGASTWVIGYDFSDAPWQESQWPYVAVASSTGVISYDADSDSAKEFAP